MKRYNFYLSEKQYNKLKELQKETGLSKSELIRRALDKFLDENKFNFSIP